jgi:tRNA (adenine-N(1)-)-methyltransferase non-catalytic subunit
MLNNISVGGLLVHIHPGNLPQKQAILAMNYDHDKMSCLISVNIYSLLRKLLLENSASTENIGELNKKVNAINESLLSESGIDSKEIKNEEDSSNDVIHMKKNVIIETDSGSDRLVWDSLKKDIGEIVEKKEITLNVVNERKRKHSDPDESTSKKPRWELETEKAADFLRLSKADGLVVVSREHPANILTALLPYVAPSRPFVVFCPYREPLLEIYVQLKRKNSTVGLRVTETWFRSHQILPSRTHPDILMSGSGGYLLTGIVVEGSTSTQEPGSSLQ